MKQMKAFSNWTPFLGADDMALASFKAVSVSNSQNVHFIFICVCFKIYVYNLCMIYQPWKQVLRGPLEVWLPWLCAKLWQTDRPSSRQTNGHELSNKKLTMILSRSQCIILSINISFYLSNYTFLYLYLHFYVYIDLINLIWLSDRSRIWMAASWLNTARDTTSIWIWIDQ